MAATLVCVWMFPAFLRLVILVHFVGQLCRLSRKWDTAIQLTSNWKWLERLFWAKICSFPYQLEVGKVCAMHACQLLTGSDLYHEALKTKQYNLKSPYMYINQPPRVQRSMDLNNAHTRL